MRWYVKAAIFLSVLALPAAGVIYCNATRKNRLPFRISRKTSVPVYENTPVPKGLDEGLPDFLGQEYSFEISSDAMASVLEEYKDFGRKPEPDSCSFGDGMRDVPEGIPFISPIKADYHFSSGFGYRTNPFNPKYRTYHGGVDMACDRGTKVYAAMPGKVTATGWDRSYGKYVIIVHGSGYTTLYAHLDRILVPKGRIVSCKSGIGLVGSTGLSTGPHLHYAVYRNGRGVNPMSVTSF